MLRERRPVFFAQLDPISVMRKGPVGALVRCFPLLQFSLAVARKLCLFMQNNLLWRCMSLLHDFVLASADVDKMPFFSLRKTAKFILQYACISIFRSVVATFIHNRIGQNCLFFRKEVWLDKLFILSICQIEEKEGHTLKQFARKKEKLLVYS